MFEGSDPEPSFFDNDPSDQEAPNGQEYTATPEGVETASPLAYGDEIGTIGEDSVQADADMLPDRDYTDSGPEDDIVFEDPTNRSQEQYPEADEITNIDVARLFADLQITEVELGQIASLSIPPDVRVTSVSPIKTNTVGDVLQIVGPNGDFDVVGVKAPSGVGELPLGQAAINGALNRLNNGVQIRQEINPDETNATAWFSIENGLFKVPRGGESQVAAEDATDKGVVQFTEDADLSPDFDPDAEYEDRAVTVIRIPGRPTIVQVSPSSEAVRIPKVAVLAAHDADGGFGQHTVGSKLAEMGLAVDKQNPHAELTMDRPTGPLPRQDQMARVIIRALLRLTQQP